MFRFTCGGKKIGLNIKKSQNIMTMILGEKVTIERLQLSIFREGIAGEEMLLNETKIVFYRQLTLKRLYF